jgi:hypothetical protein
MDDDNLHSKVSYNNELERLIADEGERIQGLAWLHEQSSAYYCKLNTNLALPIIVLSTLSGAISASSTSLFSDQRMASVGIGGVSIFVGVLSTIQSYFAYSRRAENHRLSGITCSKLNHFIMIEMALPRKERMNAHDLLKIVREQTGRLLETAPSIPEHVIKEFQRRFLDKYPNIAIPDVANGLRAIKLAPVAPLTPCGPLPARVRSPALSFFNEDKTPIPAVAYLPPTPPSIVAKLPPSPIPELSASKI